MSASGSTWWLKQISRIPLLTPSEEIELGTTIQTWLQHPDGPDGCPPGIRRRGQRAKERFVEANLRLAVSFVNKKFNRLGKDRYFDDLVQEANRGLLKAVERFDPQRGYRFSTYAAWWIKQALQEWTQKHSRTVSIPGQHHVLLARLAVIQRNYLQQYGHEAEPETLRQLLGVSEKVFEQLLVNSLQVYSLDASADSDSDGESCLLDRVQHQGAEEDQGLSDEKQRRLEQLDTGLSQLESGDRELLVNAWNLQGGNAKRRDLAGASGLKTREFNKAVAEAEGKLRVILQREIHRQLSFWERDNPPETKELPSHTRQQTTRRPRRPRCFNQLELPLAAAHRPSNRSGIHSRQRPSTPRSGYHIQALKDQTTLRRSA